jgi:hypothetical protein
VGVGWLQVEIRNQESGRKINPKSISLPVRAWLAWRIRPVPRASGDRFPSAQPGFKTQNPIGRISETDDGQKAMNPCNIGTQPVRPTVYGVKAPL